jgi:hypothetical protein
MSGDFVLVNPGRLLDPDTGETSGVYPHGRNARQLAYLVRHGMRPLDAIRDRTAVE